MYRRDTPFWKKENLEIYVEFMKLGLILDKPGTRKLQSKEFKDMNKIFLDQNSKNAYKNIFTGITSAVSTTFLCNYSTVKILKLMNSFKILSLAVGYIMMSGTSFYRASTLIDDHLNDMRKILDDRTYRSILDSEHEEVN